MNRLKKLQQEFGLLADPYQAAVLQRFFKTGQGQYGEGDIFLGIKVPEQRKAIKNYLDLPSTDLHELLSSKIHEYRLSALFILVAQFKTANQQTRNKIFKFYLNHTANINNWDLVDLSAPNIVGCYLLNRSRDILFKLMESKNIWERRIAVLATFAFIREGQFDDTLALAERLLGDKHDLMHKAVGWMLREIGKRSEPVLENFLQKHYRAMPRTMLRYAIEKLGKSKKKFYLTKAKQMIK